LAAGAVLAGLMWWLDESRSFTFRGGLALATLATVVLVASAVSGGRFSQALDLPAMRWVGERSYGIYLWHWPVILIVNADNPSVPGAPGFLWSRAWCVVVTLALGDLSYRFVESPIRRLGWRGAWSRLGTVTIGRGTSVQRGVAAAAAAAVLATLGIVATAPAQTSTQRLIEAQEKAATRTPSMAASPRIVLDAGFTMPKGSQIDAYGDSMMVGSVPALRYYFPGIRIDAKSNRRWSAGLAAIMASGHDIRRGVILSFGTNAGVEETDLRAILDRLGPKRMVVLVNIHLNMARTARDNATLARVAGDYANVIVADWNGALARATGALQPDGIHPSMTGQHVYAATIRQAFADLSERHTGKVVKLKKLPIP
ncbi:MAG TPA: acyltransferase family protein, partial [Tetrasphaera sp.]|uniref:acyltransferase family protein n=1 Tax=Nostocoides sp. TaxID=1917966 RepID=UPI002D190D07